MARPIPPNRQQLRKLALARAAMRYRETLAQAVPPAAPPPDRAVVDFLDPFMRHAAMQARGISLCAFLVALAAFQRGLKVTFHAERASFDPRFAANKLQGHRGEILSVSDGQTAHVFSRSMGDLTDPAANFIAEDKSLTKNALSPAGVPTPDGIVFAKENTALVDAFLAKYPDGLFVVKPLSGSLSRNVFAAIAADAVHPAIAQQTGGQVIVERYIAGPEYRALVVGGRCVAISWRKHPFVVGDGVATVKALMDAQQAILHARNPFWDKFGNDDDIDRFLARENLSLISIPAPQRVVFVTNTAECPYHQDVTLTAPAAVGETAVKAAQAVGLITCGVDLIAGQDGNVYVLEVNQRPHIGMHSFPYEGAGVGNRVAEAIIDHYFPQSVHNPIHGNLAFDFTPIRAALQSMQIHDLSLPVIGPDWQVLRLTESGIAAKMMLRLIETAAQVAGVYVTTAPRSSGAIDICLATAPKNWANFIALMPKQFQDRFKTAAQAANS